MKKQLSALLCSALSLTATLAFAAKPTFYHQGVVINTDTLNYNPTDEVIFPSLLKVTDHISGALGNYYLYYAPHDAPGGIAVAYSNTIEGPYTEYSNLPLISNNEPSRWNVSHISSPNVVWMEEYGKFFMYYHGENNTTRWAWSWDGLNWNIAQDNVAVTTADFHNAGFSTSISETSYARVFDYEIPTWGDRYTMVLMVNDGGQRKIALATSDDGKDFTPRDGSLVSPVPDGQSNISGAFYWQDAGKHYVLYHGSSNIYYTEVGANFNLENHQGVFYDPTSGGAEQNKAAEPYLVYDNNQWHMFYSVGARLSQNIGYANETNPAVDMIIDNNSSGFLTSSSGWNSSTSTSGYQGSDYLYDVDAAGGSNVWASWRPTFPNTATYKVYARWTSHSNRPDNIKYKVYAQGQVTEVYRDQTINGGSWQLLGTFTFGAGTSDANRVTLDAASDSGHTIADAVRFVLD
ncbi:hypothetical protein [Reinekea blandensis]|nr:hypothetical protein [Reinekea blandensis]